ncbi:hypothetical protein [Endozoicomonas sp. 8E]|uniref:hypothetical protein n=1 Tax=Endozoicomonas sp. 8E TaxID=3035692 RepID=UPI0029390E2E|nr:hypothetical protein [Endozoicomonas sp. 8E]WOG27416.1 hypothetical protein P6910_23160 [Endozoicomonas sp. 8E]
MDKDKLLALMNTGVTKANLNEYGRFDELTDSIDKPRAKAYFETFEGAPVANFRVNIKAANLLRSFILQEGFELETPDGD